MTIFSFSTVTGKYFVGNPLCRSDDCRATHSYFAVFHNKQCLLKNPRKKIQMSQIWRMMGPGNASPSSHPMISKFLVQIGTLMLSVKRIITSPYMTIVPVEYSINMKCHLIQKTNF
jgi:hypothetical protein